MRLALYPEFVDAELAEQREETYTRRLHRRRLLLGAYGVPIWLIPLIRTDRAPLASDPPLVDRERYPAELHIGVRRDWRRTHGSLRGVPSAEARAWIPHIRLVVPLRRRAILSPVRA